MKFLEILNKLLEYGRNSKFELVQRVCSESPKFHQVILKYGGAALLFVSGLIYYDIAPAYNQYLEPVMYLLIGIVATAKTPKADKNTSSL